MQFWNDFEGEVIGGDYPLQKLVRSDGRNAWFATENGSTGKAIVSVTELLNDQAAILERLEAARGIHHENILKVRQVGTAEIKGTALVYAVLDPVEEDLSDVLRERSLSTSETETIVRSLVAGLTELHRNGLVHARVEPASVLAIDDVIKLRSDCVQLSRKVIENGIEDWSGPDFRGLGSTICQCLTRRAPAAPDDPLVASLPAPYPAIVKNLLEARWTSAEVLRSLETPVFPLRTEAARAERRSDAAVRAAELAGDTDLEIEKNKGPFGLGRRMPVFAGISVVVLFLLVWFVVRGKSPANTSASTGTPSNAAASSQPAPPPARSDIVSPAPVSSAKAAKPSPAGPRVVVPLNGPATGAPIAAATPTLPAAKSQDGAEVWRVVAYTYNRREDAQRKADDINQKHSAWNASVFQPKSGRAPYLVTVGGAMDRDAALRLRDTVRHSGLPRDSYAQNYH